MKINQFRVLCRFKCDQEDRKETEANKTVADIISRLT